MPYITFVMEERSYGSGVLGFVNVLTVSMWWNQDVHNMFM